jgi:hypothetical protein
VSIGINHIFSIGTVIGIIVVGLGLGNSLLPAAGGRRRHGALSGFRPRPERFVVA